MNLTTFKAKSSAIFFALLASFAALPAMAAGEAATITSVFTEYKIEVLILVVAFAVVLWTIKGAGLLKPRG